MSNIPYPNITGRTTEDKISQIISYLRQLADQLNFEGVDSPSGSQQPETDKT